MPRPPNLAHFVDMPCGWAFSVFRQTRIDLATHEQVLFAANAVAFVLSVQVISLHIPPPPPPLQLPAVLVQARGRMRWSVMEDNPIIVEVTELDGHPIQVQSPVLVKSVYQCIRFFKFAVCIRAKANKSKLWKVKRPSNYAELSRPGDPECGLDDGVRSMESTVRSSKCSA